MQQKSICEVSSFRPQDVEGLLIKRPIVYAEDDRGSNFGFKYIIICTANVLYCIQTISVGSFTDTAIFVKVMFSSY